MAQQNHPWWLSVDMGYGRVLADKGKYDYDPNTKQGMGKLSAKLGYYLTPKFSLGAAIGANIYQYSDITTFPIAIDLRYHLTPHLFAYTDIGIPLAAETAGYWANDDNRDYIFGGVADIGLGGRWMGKRAGLTASLGYHLFPYSLQINDENKTFTDNRITQGIFLQIGIEFLLFPLADNEKKEVKSKRFWYETVVLFLFGRYPLN
ncbi:hypothetical protein AGMMS4956_16810 [Bacteroidia bacterium]|nr:hypothetical protein AGMMS4956_16810 [Bacteroidia bacterium]